ncbi:hypothetical protein ACFU8Q_23420 [Streptomyces sp. NPDC057543]|uniref:hypothetical protein n=1 Tax=Streptomyces sp. NPDC057543 TaxID=3346163 RepID=UPI0036C36AAC
MLCARSIDYIDRFSINMALPSIGEEFHLGKTAQGSLVTVFALVYMICQIPAPATWPIGMDPANRC